MLKHIDTMVISQLFIQIFQRSSKILRNFWEIELLKKYLNLNLNLKLNLNSSQLHGSKFGGRVTIKKDKFLYKNYMLVDFTFLQSLKNQKVNEEYFRFLTYL